MIELYLLKSSIKQEKIESIGKVMYKILLVDDERNERIGIEKLIKRYGYEMEVLQATNGEEALEVFQKEEIDVLLTDIKMPYMTGMELIEQVKKRGHNPICIIYSAYGEFEYAQDAISLGVLQYLLKPIKLEEFQKLFQKVVEICSQKRVQMKESETLRQTLLHIEKEKQLRRVLQYLEAEQNVEMEAESNKWDGIFDKDSYIPIIYSSYSNFFNLYWEQCEQEIYRILGEGTIILNRNDTQFLLLVEETVFREKQASEFCEQLIELSITKYQSEVFLIVGNSCGTMQELKREYEKIREQLDYQFFLSKSTYFLYDKDGTIKKKRGMLPLYFEKILTFAKLRDFKGLKQEFARSFEYVEKTVGFSSIYIKYNFSEMIKRCCEILHSEEKMLRVVEDIYGSHSLFQVKQAIFYLLDSLLEEEKENGEENHLVTLAKTIVEEQYSDVMLNVSSVAEQLGVSAAYMSTVFKGNSNQNLVKYISQYRIEVAKELLKTTNMKVGDIAKKVGYANASYFISLFRDNVGISPLKFREGTEKSE